MSIIGRCTLALALSACFVMSPAMANDQPIVFIVSLHNLDYAKNACNNALAQAPDAQKTIRELSNNPYGKAADWVYHVVEAANECKSVRDTRALGRKIENELTDALAIDPHCAGVTVIRDRAARLAAIPAGESPANRGVQSLL